MVPPVLQHHPRAPRALGSADAPLLRAEPVSVGPAVLGTQGWQCCPGRCVAGERGEGHRGCPCVAADSWNICHVPALITVIGCQRPCWRLLCLRGGVRAAQALMLRARGSPCPRLAICPQPRDVFPRACGDTAHASRTHVGVCFSPTPNNVVVAAAGWEGKASGRVWPQRGYSGAL